jgi:hypothetical protein
MFKHFNMRKIPFIILLLSALSFRPHQQSLTGAWELKEGGITHTLVVVDDYFSLSSFDIGAKRFIRTLGGTCRANGTKLEGVMEYETAEREKVRSNYAYPFSFEGGRLRIERNGKSELWTRTDDGVGPLAGNWRITGREQNGQMSEIRPAARKTIKLLSGRRFQWAAINTDTGEFFGTGGGRYTFESGIYTEYIEFFSRDSSRVGMQLQFNGRVEGRNWYHSGKSSKGDPISEVWSR